VGRPRFGVVAVGVVVGVVGIHLEFVIDVGFID